MKASLGEVEKLIADLSESDRHALHERLGTSLERKQPMSDAEKAESIENFRRLGRQLAAMPPLPYSVVEELSRSRG